MFSHYLRINYRKYNNKISERLTALNTKLILYSNDIIVHLS